MLRPVARKTCPAAAMAGALLLLGAARPGAGASALRETSDFADVVSAVTEYVQKYGGERVLAAIDLDNTLLAMEGDLGSDQWFEWQSYLLANDPTSPHLAARNFPGLLEVQGLLFDLKPMRLTQPQLPLLVGRIQGLGARTIVLTARGEEFRGATEYELKRHGYDFASHALEVAKRQAEPPRSAAADVFMPYRLSAVDESGITAEEAKAWNLRAPAPVSYGNGIYMVAGQHKGAMLAVLLKRAAQDFQAVVFVDQDRQVRRVYDALQRRGYDVTVFDYQREDRRVKDFQYSDKSAVTRQWRQLRDRIDGRLLPVEGPLTSPRSTWR